MLFNHIYGVQIAYILIILGCVYGMYDLLVMVLLFVVTIVGIFIGIKLKAISN